MDPAQFKAWRKSLGLKQREAADKLGLKKRMIQYYETGQRDGKDVKIPRSIRLACYALSQGIDDFHGGAALAPASTPVQDADAAAETASERKRESRKRKAA